MMKQFKLGNKTLLSDPSYDLGTWCTQTIDTKPGNWFVDIATTQNGRCASMYAVHEDYKDIDPEDELTEYSTELGVDAGLMGIFDLGYFKHEVDKNNDWYKSMCDKIGGEEMTVYPEAVICHSGYGDGTYFAMMERRGNQIVRIQIDFIDAVDPRLVYEESDECEKDRDIDIDEDMPGDFEPVEEV